MAVALFVFFHDRTNPAGRVAPVDLETFTRVAARTPGLTEAHIFTPGAAHDPFLKDPPPPQLSAQLYFDDLPPLEEALAPNGHLHQLAAPDALPSLAGATVTHQAMLVRRFPVPDATFHTAPGKLAATYLVEYPGSA
ncbi:MAG: hypothetical protein ABIU95_08835, partial [Burkholderiales bacterium]